MPNPDDLRVLRKEVEVNLERIADSAEETES